MNEQINLTYEERIQIAILIQREQDKLDDIQSDDEAITQLAEILESAFNKVSPISPEDLRKNLS